jgi:hypothetical protein
MLRPAQGDRMQIVASYALLGMVSSVTSSSGVVVGDRQA